MAKKKIMIDSKIVCTGLLCLTVLELYALSQGINGWVLSAIIGIIAGAIGIATPLDKFIKH